MTTDGPIKNALDAIELAPGSLRQPAAVGQGVAVRGRRACSTASRWSGRPPGCSGIRRLGPRPEPRRRRSRPRPSSGPRSAPAGKRSPTRSVDDDAIPDDATPMRRPRFLSSRCCIAARRPSSPRPRATAAWQPGTTAALDASSWEAAEGVDAPTREPTLIMRDAEPPIAPSAEMTPSSRAATDPHGGPRRARRGAHEGRRVVDADAARRAGRSRLERRARRPRAATSSRSRSTISTTILMRRPRARRRCAVAGAASRCSTIDAS